MFDSFTSNRLSNEAALWHRTMAHTKRRLYIFSSTLIFGNGLFAAFRIVDIIYHSLHPASPTSMIHRASIAITLIVLCNTIGYLFARRLWRRGIRLTTEYPETEPNPVSAAPKTAP
jgi:Zn-dependent protease with chaperone function